MPSVRFSPLVLLSAGCLLAADKPAPRVAPYYSAASIVNAADNQSGQLAPNLIVTVYGTNLAYGTAAITQNYSFGGTLPTVLGASETQVYVDDYPADLYYVSPTQVNFLVPPNLITDRVSVRVTVDSLTGPAISVLLGPAAPGLFQLDSVNAVATFVDGSVVTPQAPGAPRRYRHPLGHGPRGHQSRTGLRPGARLSRAAGSRREPRGAAGRSAGGSRCDHLCRLGARFCRPVSNQFDPARVHRLQSRDPRPSRRCH